MAERTQRFDTGVAILSASAIGLAAAIIMQAGRLPVNAAYADQVVTDNGYTLLTADSGAGSESDPDELLYVIDNRSEMLLVYEVRDAQNSGISPIANASGRLSALFASGAGR